jgi:hypothetical protein
MSWNGAGSIHALGCRLTKLDASGAPLVGARNAYTTEQLVSVTLNNVYSEPEAVELTNGQGQTCVFYQPTAVLLGGTIEEFRFCTPDPLVMQFLVGGDLITTGGTDEVQTITITGTPTGGTFTLTFDGQTTSAIAYNATASTVQTALLALSNLAPGDVVVTGGPGPATPWVATFGGAYNDTDVPAMTATGSFTGGTSPAIAVATTTGGVAGPTTIGYRAPRVNTDPVPNGVAIELWTHAVQNNALLPGGLHFVLPRAKLRPSEGLTMNAEDALTPTFEGSLEPNENFGNGGLNDIVFPTDRVWQYAYLNTIPTLSGGLITTIADS